MIMMDEKPTAWRRSTCDVWITVTSFIMLTPAAIRARSPAVPNSILFKNLFSISVIFPSVTILWISSRVFSFYKEACNCSHTVQQNVVWIVVIQYSETWRAVVVLQYSKTWRVIVVIQYSETWCVDVVLQYSETWCVVVVIQYSETWCVVVVVQISETWCVVVMIQYSEK